MIHFDKIKAIFEGNRLDIKTDVMKAFLKKIFFVLHIVTIFQSNKVLQKKMMKLQNKSFGKKSLV